MSITVFSGPIFRRALTVLLLILCAMEFWFFLINPLLSVDTSWLVYTGMYILEHASVPSHDIFSFTNPDKDSAVDGKI